MIERKIIDGVVYLSAKDIYTTWKENVAHKKVKQIVFFTREATKKACLHYEQKNNKMPIITTKGRNGNTWVIEEIAVMFTNWLYDIPYSVNSFSRNEEEFGSILHNIFIGILTIKKQYLFDAFNVDFYIPELKLVIEYDEKHHKYEKHQIKDDYRQKFIIDNFNVSIIGHKEPDNIGITINKILKIMQTNTI
jgi:very-short-patch-repair endonuclease